MAARRTISQMQSFGPPLTEQNASVSRWEEDRVRSAAWARELLGGGEFCVLDSETTGLSKPRDFVEVAVVDPDGEILCDTLVRPSCRIERGAMGVHGYTAESLASAPAFRELYPDLLEALWGRRVIVYNAAYDRGVWDEAVGRLGARATLAGELPAWECAMRQYAAFIGERTKRGGYRWQKLPSADHTAVGDARATLEVLESMTRTQRSS